MCEYEYVVSRFVEYCLSKADGNLRNNIEIGGKKRSACWEILAVPRDPERVRVNPSRKPCADEEKHSVIYLLLSFV